MTAVKQDSVRRLLVAVGLAAAGVLGARALLPMRAAAEAGQAALVLPKGAATIGPTARAATSAFAPLSRAAKTAALRTAGVADVPATSQQPCVLTVRSPYADGRGWLTFGGGSVDGGLNRATFSNGGDVSFQTDTLTKGKRYLLDVEVSAYNPQKGTAYHILSRGTGGGELTVPATNGTQHLLIVFEAPYDLKPGDKWLLDCVDITNQKSVADPRFGWSFIGMEITPL